MPSPAVLADLGVKAVKDGKYEEGIRNLTEALRERPAPLWLLERSKAYLRTGAIPHALRDAERALRVAFDRANRDLMIEAQIRRAVAYFRLARYANADVCAFWALRLLDGARATEDDGQMRLRDDQGDYPVRAADIHNPTAGEQDGLSVAMKSGDTKSKEMQLKNQAFSWRVQALSQLEKLPAGDPGRKVGVKDKYPNPSMEEEEPIDVGKEEYTSESKPTAAKTTSAPEERDEAARKAAWEELWNQYNSLHAKNNVRSSFYQTDTTLNVDIFVKNVPKEDFKVDAQEDSISLGPIPNTHSGQIHLFLYGKIKPEETTYTVKSMKIELVLKKVTPGKWPTLRGKNSELVDNLALASFPQPSFNQFHTYITGLGYSNPEDLNLNGPVGEQTAWYDDLLEKLRASLRSTSSTTDKSTPAASTTPGTTASSTVQPTSTSSTNKSPLSDQTNKPKEVAPTTTTTSGPAYPTSSKKGPKNWDKIDDLDDDNKDGAGGDVDSFFKTLYQNADPDTRRAMMKSYVESNGTSLSTSWSEAKDKTYVTVPPDGSEAKDW